MIPSLALLLAGCPAPPTTPTLTGDTGTPADTADAPTADTGSPTPGHTGAATGDTAATPTTGDTATAPPPELSVPGCPPAFTPVPADLASCGSSTRHAHSYHGSQGTTERTYDAAGRLVDEHYTTYSFESRTRYTWDVVTGDLLRTVETSDGDAVTVVDATWTRDGQDRVVRVAYHRVDRFGANPPRVTDSDEVYTWGACGIEVATSSSGSITTTEYYVDGTREWLDGDGDGAPERSKEHVVDLATGAPIEDRTYEAQPDPTSTATWTVDPVTGWILAERITDAGSPTDLTWTYDGDGRELTQRIAFDDPYYYGYTTLTDTTTWTCP